MEGVLKGAETLQMMWTTDWFARCNPDLDDKGRTTFGPDGPWQALCVGVGTPYPSTPGWASRNIRTPFWPTGSHQSEVLTSHAAGGYAPTNSSSAVKTGVYAGRSDLWFSDVFQNRSTWGSVYFDTIALFERDDRHGTEVQITLTIVAEKDRSLPLPDGRNFSDPVGILGLGPLPRYDIPPYFGRSDFLQQLKRGGQIGSRSFGLHMGSAALQQPGSMVLGGYEQNRALGSVGVFSLFSSEVFLVDVILGTQKGASPFKNLSEVTSVYRGPGPDDYGQAASLEVKRRGGKAGSALAVLNPASPYIYLPPGTCETAATYLPVVWDDRLGLYLWITSDPQFARIVSSPGYMGFVLSDSTATNLTIKVPFPLLNLTLEAPLVDKPTQYFPCKPFSSPWGRWQLGRAFLQGAFMAVNFDNNLTFVSQAPGPNMDQSVRQVIRPTDRSIRTNNISTFEETWSGYWTPLPDDNAVLPPSSGLPAWSMAAIVTGAIAGSLCIGLAASVLSRQRARWWKPRWLQRGLDDSHGLLLSPDGLEFWEPPELGAQDTRYELSQEIRYELAQPLLHELDITPGYSEAPASLEHWVHELPPSHDG